MNSNLKVTELHSLNLNSMFIEFNNSSEVQFVYLLDP